MICVKGCEPGFIGLNCTLHCPKGIYGKDCQHICSCEVKDCHHVFGCFKRKVTFINTL